MLPSVQLLSVSVYNYSDCWVDDSVVCDSGFDSFRHILSG